MDMSWAGNGSPLYVNRRIYDLFDVSVFGSVNVQSGRDSEVGTYTTDKQFYFEMQSKHITLKWHLLKNPHTCIRRRETRHSTPPGSNIYFIILEPNSEFNARDVTCDNWIVHKS